jgi:hypothetical protein
MVGPQEPSRTPRLADPTRDIRLPPLPGRAGPELPPEWEAWRTERPVEPPPAVDPAVDPAVQAPDTLSDQPTDQLGEPPRDARDRTLTFSGTAAQRWAAGHPATPDPAWSSVPPEPGPVVVGPRPRAAVQRSRRWPWIVLALLPILVIAVTGAWLLVLMQGG